MKEGLLPTITAHKGVHLTRCVGVPGRGVCVMEDM